MANRCSEFPYENITWCVEHEDGTKVAQKFKLAPKHEQLIFKGDRVRILFGPDKGKVSWDCYHLMIAYEVCFIDYW